MTTVKYLSWLAIVWGCACSNGGDADNGSRSDWVSCDTSSDCGNGESCVEERCEAPEEEPEPSASSAEEPEPNPSSEADPEADPDDAEPAPATSDEPEPNTADDDGGVGDSASVPDAVTAPVLPDVANEVSVDSGLFDQASVSDAGTPVSLDAGSVPTACGDANPCASTPPVQCEQLSNSATADGCESVWYCSQEIEIGEVEQGSGTALLTCTSSGGTFYSCVCSGGSEDLSFSVMSSSSFTACSDISACSTRLRL